MREVSKFTLILVCALMASCAKSSDRSSQSLPPPPASDQSDVSSGASEANENPSRGSDRAPSTRDPIVPSQGITKVGERYRLFVPSAASASVSSTARNQKLPLLVLIHGCDQNAELMQKGAQMDAEADRLGFFVLYPEQMKNRNPYNCWRWFDPANRAPNSGELAEILGMIDKVAEKNPIDLSKVFVAGISSGGGTAAALLACHPDRFQGAALHSSPAFDVASTEVGALAVMRFGPAPFYRPFGSKCKPALKDQRLLVIYGSDDDVVNPLNSTTLISQFTPLGTREILHKLKLNSMGERATEVKCYETNGSKSEACLVRVEGLKHSWAGGFQQDYFDPKAFSATEMVSRFLIQNEEPFEVVAGAGAAKEAGTARAR